jgi:hypothetical protein
MADRIVTNSERGFTVTVNDIEHQESQSLNGIAVIKIFFRPNVEHRDGGDASDGDLPDRAARTASGHDSSAGGYLYGIVDAGCATRVKQQDTSRAAIIRSRAEFSAHAVEHGSGCGYSLSFRRQAAPDSGRPRFRQAAGLWLVAQRHRQRGGRTEPDSADRYGQDRADRVQRGDERHSARLSPNSTISRSRLRTRPRFTCAMWRTCAMGLCRKPTSCARTACAAC